MKLKFIGTDGSMGLKHGDIYDVRIESDDRFIWVRQYKGLKVAGECPYSSPATLSANWAKPGKKVVVRKKSKPVESVEQCEWVWTEIGESDYDKFWICPKCHEHTYIKTNFCSKCGCKMSGGAKDETN